MCTHALPGEGLVKPESYNPSNPHRRDTKRGGSLNPKKKPELKCRQLTFGVGKRTRSFEQNTSGEDASEMYGSVTGSRHSKKIFEPLKRPPV